MKDNLFDIETERNVLGAILLERSCLTVAREILKYPDEDVFYDPHNQAMWHGLNTLYDEGTPFEPLTVSQLLGEQYEATVIDLASRTPTWTHLEYHCKKILELYERRRVVDRATDMVHMARDPQTPLSEIPLAEVAIDHSEGVEEDPGFIPEEFLEIPGFVSKLMAHTMSVAPYPNKYMSFCGALSMLSTVVGRKVTDLYDTRANLYVLGLAESGSGKDHPRKVNLKIANEIGAHNDRDFGTSVVNNFASKEGIEDMLKKNPILLWQCDEMDGLLRSMDGYTNENARRMMEILLELYTTSSSSYTVRLKANAESSETIVLPNLNLFGTCIPKNFYEAMSEKMMSNGMFGRMLIVEDNTKRVPNDHISRDKSIPESILAQVRYWMTQCKQYDYSNGGGTSASSCTPEKAYFTHSPEAMQLLRGIRDIYDGEYETCREDGDSMGTSVWARAFELTNKLALLYTCSENPYSRVIRWTAVEWASKLVDHQCRRMLFKAREKAFGTTHEKNSNRLIELLRRARENSMKRSEITRKLRDLTSREIDDILDTLSEANIVQVWKDRTGKGRAPLTVKLLKGGK